MNRYRASLIIVLLCCIMAFFAFDIQRFFTLETLKNQQDSIVGFKTAHPFLASALYGILYVAVTGLSLPGATVMTLAGGAVFGLLWGTVLVSFASSIGATLAFLAARFLFRDAVKARFGEQGVIDLIAVSGYYVAVSMTLNTAQTQLPPGVSPPLQPLRNRQP